VARTIYRRAHGPLPHMPAPGRTGQEARMPALRYLACLSCTVLLLLPTLSPAQSFNGAITGVVRDSSGAVVPDAALTLRNVATNQVSGTAVSGAQGEYSFRNLAPATYELLATKTGFQQVVLPDIVVTLSTQVRVDVELPVGGLEQRVEVQGVSSILSTTGTQEHGISPETLGKLPLIFETGPRSSAGFATLMPGVTTGGRGNAFDARINGGLQSGDEATVDGVSMQQGFMSQGGMVSIFWDFPMSPDMVSEVKVLTSNYAPEYGASISGQIMAVTKSGGSDFHGALFEYHRNDSLNATQWGAARKNELRKNNFGANLGGPAKVPGLWSDRVKSYFYFNYEGYRQVGGSNQPTLSIPSIAQRNGDFRDWRDSDGNLIPIYDPATIRPDGQGGYIKDQFMGCDGRTPNVICPSRISPLVRAWLDALPVPTSAGPTNNFLAPAIPDTILGNSNYYMGRFDLQYGNDDHFFLSVWHQRAPAKFVSTLPQPIANETYSDPQNSWVSRFNWDRTFSDRLLNHMSMGYLNRNEGYGSVNAEFVNDFPQIQGVAGSNVPPRMEFSDGFEDFGNNAGVNVGNITTRPTFIINDMVTWSLTDHTLKFGMEFRSVMGNIHTNGNQAGTFRFARGATGLLGVNSGSPIASFLLGAVDNADVAFRAVDSWYPRQHAWVFHGADTWRVNDKLTVDYGLRWDYFSPSSEKFDRLSFFDPVGANPGAGGRPGRLAFAGDGYGEASFGARYPEENWYGGFAPRLGLVYALNDKTTIRSGYGIFYTQAFYPGWGGGISLDGFSNTPVFSSSLGGIQPAFLLEQGFPQNFEDPPIIRSDYKNGQTIVMANGNGSGYRPFDANKRPYSHQWNITVDREIGDDLALSVAYVGTLGRRIPSSIAPINAIDPRFLSMGNALYDQFEPGMTSLHGVPLPYAGWVEQMTGCPPSVAQALRPYPQYCDNFQGMNENYGESEYNALQVKMQKRFSEGTFALVSYTLSRTVSSGADNTQSSAGSSWSGAQGVISPFERERNKTVATDDIPHVLSAAFVYELPFGEGRRFLNKGGVVNALVGGWQASTVYRYSSGLPFFFRVNGTPCNVPTQFRAGCIPAIINPGAVFAQDKGNFDPARGPLFDRGAFEPVSAFNFYYGRGNRIEEDVRGFAYQNQDLSFIKNTRLPRNMNLQFRIEMFNVWNWHIFGARGTIMGSITDAFDLDLASPTFGNWKGGVSDPRNIQLAVRLEF
jgi:Carboxypeptidase regulatory-like domain/TonB dependent receptor-like, beta-barrel